jgi:hypothetical protein
MPTKEQMEKEIADWNKANPRNHTLLNEETEIPERKIAELRFIRSRDILFLLGQSVLPRLETTKDFLRYDITGKPRNPNVWGMTCTGADAKVHKDILGMVLKDVELDGIVSKLHCKEINKNAIVYIDVAFMEKYIADNKKGVVVKDTDGKQTTVTPEQMTQRLQSAIRLKTRAGYERK